ncbi:hypothetical protein QJS04_geneDACA006675 [Acorus gramineus]|uniref:DNA topoisomerase n=1 Tax=Acorus gramineus TaxID=55184 RepID=A0AAV9AVW7_ACOGR|nr:hypothetical protein QJS04_geneDACA006675 [Acorus gramineus]
MWSCSTFTTPTIRLPKHSLRNPFLNNPSPIPHKMWKTLSKTSPLPKNLCFGHLGISQTPSPPLKTRFSQLGLRQNGDLLSFAGVLGRSPLKCHRCPIGILSFQTSPRWFSSAVKAPKAERKQKEVKTKTGLRVSKKNVLGPLYPPSGKSVVVVESVTKAGVIQRYLGDMFEVVPSYGHIRDLVGKSGSVCPDNDFSMVWEVKSTSKAHFKTIKGALDGAENLILASDPDREGEAIAWHITRMLQEQGVLKENTTVARVVFHEITESAIKTALQSPRDIDVNLVNAYLARRALDYLIGFSISPVLWRKLPGCPSAGRVQSAALALICNRELEIDQFKPDEYWGLGVTFHRDDKNSNSIPSKLTHFNSEKLEKMSIGSSALAEAIKQKVSLSKFKVINIKSSRPERQPPMPYITSTLQQDSANRLQFSAVYTMVLAQKLYEGVKLSDNETAGLITYIRTDGLHISKEAAEDILCLISERYGKDFASKSPRTFFKKVKNSQEAHEAIRPTNIRRLPSSLVGILDDDSLKLYTLIWSRAMACQMESTITDMKQIDIANAEEDIVFRSTGSRLRFLGYQAVYKDGEVASIISDLNEGNSDVEAYEVLSSLKVKDSVHLGMVDLVQHFTKPPSRYSEGTLVKRLEDLGIGRPSTYASIIKVLQDRNYVAKKNRVLVPEFRGRMVSVFLSAYFSEVVDYSFTADMETELDNVSSGVTEWKGLLKDYWSRVSKKCDFVGPVTVREVEGMLEKTFENIVYSSLPNENRTCPSCSVGTLKFKVSRFGPGYFIGCDQHPKCKYIFGKISSDEKPEKIQPKLLGLCPVSGRKIYLKKGPFGFYVQLGEDKKGHKPERASVSQDINTDDIQLEEAIKLLSSKRMSRRGRSKKKATIKL